MLKGAQVDLARYQGLAAQNAVPRQTLDTQIALVAQYQGTIEADTAAVKSAQVNLQYCHILSPLDGRVGLRQVDQGNYVTPGDTNGIVVITQLKPISVLFTVPEDNLQAISKRLQSGAVLQAAAFDRGGARKIADGALLTFDSQIDPTTGTIKLRAQFPNETEALYPNQFVNIQLLLDTHKGVTTMPTAGVQRGVPGTFVYLVNADDTVSVRKIDLGVTDGDHVEVRNGLQPGDKIVVDGADKLRDGARINVRAEAGNPNAPAAGGAAAPGGVNSTVPEDNLQAISKRLQSGAVLQAAAFDRGGAKKIADGALLTFDSQIDPTTGRSSCARNFRTRPKRSIPTSSSTSSCCSTPTRASPRCRRPACSAACPARSSISSMPTTPSRSARSISA